MSWSCEHCTYTNSNGKEKNCSMCGRKEKTSSGSRRVTQQTLSFQPAVVDLTGGDVNQHKKTKQSSMNTSTIMTNKKKRKHSFASTVRETPPSPQEIYQVLHQVFGLNKLRSIQQQVVNTAVSLKRESSQLVVMATGGGKSLCYQLPACVLGGVTIVISPLIALMQDQVLALQKKQIPAACFSSNNTNKENDAILHQVRSSQLVMLYITPESIQTHRMQSILNRLHQEKRLALFCVDEAHCLSSWGHDFRPAYRKLNWLRQNFPSITVMACTATATPKVIQDIKSTLSLEKVEKGRLDRSNIMYKVVYKNILQNPMDDLVSRVKKLASEQDKADKETFACGIVYVHKRADTTMIANAISKKTGIPTAAYHGSLSKKERKRVQEEFPSKIPIVVATVAFGMGIDVPNVRYVFHWSIPKSLEAFSQESGRAGRDGMPSHSILYYDQQDARTFEFLLNQQHQKQQVAAQKKKKPPPDPKLLKQKLRALDQMKEFCMTPQCRRNCLVKHFGGEAVQCNKTCDLCSDEKRIKRNIESVLVAPARNYNATARKSANEWDGQWSAPHGDEYDDDIDDEDAIAKDWGDNDDGFVGELQVTSGRNKICGQFGGNSGFTKASSLLGKKKSFKSVLDKYERMESKQQQLRETGSTGSGFLRFSSKSSSAPIIPEHLRAAVPKSLSCNQPAKTKEEVPQKSALDMQQELDELTAEQAKRMKVLLEKQKKRKGQESVASKNAISTTLKAPPPLTFGTVKRRRKK